MIPAGDAREAVRAEVEPDPRPVCHRLLGRRYGWTGNPLAFLPQPHTEIIGTREP